MTRQVAIVGGSAAGLFLARTLAAQKLRVRVFEGTPLLNPEPRTLIVTSRMRDILGSLEGGSVVNEITHFELFTNGHSATVALHRPDLVVERATLIKGLAESARASGACVLEGHRFQGLSEDRNRLALAVDHGGRTDTIHADVVVGADGAASRVARAAGWPRQETVPLLQAIVRWPKSVPRDRVRVWFVPDETPYFYWLIPESNDRGVLGLIADDGSTARSALERFLAKQQLEPMELQAARVPLYTRWIPIHKRIGDGDVYLVGDACGQVKVTTLGGVVTGFRGAIAVAEAVLKDSNREMRALRRELDRHLLVRRVLHGFTQDDYSRLITLLHAPARTLLSKTSRDEAHRLLLRLCVRQPRLLLLAARAFLSRSTFPTAKS
jgi:flavin-dependent dehydrogenase